MLRIKRAFQFGESSIKEKLTKEIERMKGLLNLVAIILVIGWLLSVFYYEMTGPIHSLIILAIVAFFRGNGIQWAERKQP
jgi:hypothetical protein